MRGLGLGSGAAPCGLSPTSTPSLSTRMCPDADTVHSIVTSCPGSKKSWTVTEKGSLRWKTVKCRSRVSPTAPGRDAVAVGLRTGEVEHAAPVVEAVHPHHARERERSPQGAGDAAAQIHRELQLVQVLRQGLRVAPPGGRLCAHLACHGRGGVGARGPAPSSVQLAAVPGEGPLTCLHM
ncbi:unnamed protein product [Prorocentrum cordatum]|uniref:Uncharacterized protein n=1 Tax=Prorocentrum cordatum TaxID=2364126 RepID=A0ABN9T6N1_9DINO|nr:unnamed protein product [Polarella glacialis]|mmetsp:Transcript_132210/g.359030  ORF Transcript_132210/g.359030 Transcript_132210/m.359030 type:complete len:180 (+) Transcript_132210:134-673(+)